MGQIWQNSIPYSGAGSTDYVDVTTTLLVGETTKVVCNNAFTEDSVVDIFTDPYGVVPKNAVISPGLITLTFNAKSYDVDILIRVYKERSGGGATYGAGKLISIQQNLINVRMEKATDATIAQRSAQDNNTLFYTAGTGGSIYTTNEYLSVNGWTLTSGVYYQDISVYGITTTTNILVTPVPSYANYTNYMQAEILAVSQSLNTIRFRASYAPSATIGINIAFWE